LKVEVFFVVIALSLLLLPLLSEKSSQIRLDTS
jgi:hypothetical protein